jgi:hypothetical protein
VRLLVRVLIICVLIIAFVALLLGESISFRQCIQQTYNQNQTNTVKNEFEKNRAALFHCGADFVHKYRDEVTAAATVILALSTLFLWLATGDLVKGSERTARRQLRAYVGIESGHMNLEISNGGIEAQVTLRIKNFGQTPAYEVRGHGGVAIAAKFSASLQEKEGPIAGQNAVFPQSSQRALFGGHLEIPPGSDPIGIFAFGHFSYKDAFGHRQRTNFRYTARALAGETELVPCEEGNEAT